MEVLANTGSKVIIESSIDKLWVIGVPLSRVDCLDSTLWMGQGLLGEILCERCQEYFESSQYQNVVTDRSPAPIAAAITTNTHQADL